MTWFRVSPEERYLFRFFTSQCHRLVIFSPVLQDSRARACNKCLLRGHLSPEGVHLPTLPTCLTCVVLLNHRPMTLYPHTILFKFHSDDFPSFLFTYVYLPACLMLPCLTLPTLYFARAWQSCLSVLPNYLSLPSSILICNFACLSVWSFVA